MQISDNLFEVVTDFLHVGKEGRYSKTFKHYFQNIQLEELKEQLNTEDKKWVFWINLYNAYVQVLLNEEPHLFRNPNDFYNARQLNIAQRWFSLRQIELGIIRRKSLFVSLPIDKEYRLIKDTPNIHFALNMGTESSPPITFYQIENYSSQLDDVIKEYFRLEANYSEEDNVLFLPKIMQWYRKDFGGQKGVLEFAKKYLQISTDAKPKIKYKAYNWSIRLSHFLESE